MAARIVVVPLEDGTAAHLVRWHGRVEIHVNETVPTGLRRCVAHHCVSSHKNGCYTRHCAAARSWLRDPRSAPPATVASA